MSFTVDDVAAWGKFPLPPLDSAELALLERVVDATVEHLVEHYVVDEDPDEWPATVLTAAQMRALSLWERRKTPDGVARFGDQAAIRIRGFDPDVDALLTRKPAFG